LKSQYPDIDKVNSAWESICGNFPPVAHLLKFEFNDSWIRFHALPDSKRYPDSEGDLKSIIEFHNSILSNFYQFNDVAYLITTVYIEDPDSSRFREIPDIEQIDPNYSFWKTVSLHEVENDPDFPNYWNAFASEWKWENGIFDGIFTCVANDRLFNVLIVSPKSGLIYHPYDGGCDIISNDSIAINRIIEKFTNHIPKNSNGL
jgi:hypothetical protein